VTLHEQVRYSGHLTVLKVTVTVCHTAEHYGEEYDDWNSAVLSSGDMLAGGQTNRHGHRGEIGNHGPVRAGRSVSRPTSCRLIDVTWALLTAVVMETGCWQAPGRGRFVYPAHSTLLALVASAAAQPARPLLLLHACG